MKKKTIIAGYTTFWIRQSVLDVNNFIVIAVTKNLSVLLYNNLAMTSPHWCPASSLLVSLRRVLEANPGRSHGSADTLPLRHSANRSLPAPIYCLIITGILWHSPEVYFTGSTKQNDEEFPPLSGQRLKNGSWETNLDNIDLGNYGLLFATDSLQWTTVKVSHFVVILNT